VLIKPAEHVTAHHLPGRPGGGAALGQVHDLIHHRKQRIDIVRGQQHGHPLLLRDPRDQLDDLLPAAQVEVRQRLVHQQQARLGYQRVGDQDALLLPAGQGADPLIRERSRTDGGEHPVHRLPPTARRQPRPEPPAVEPQRDKVPRTQRRVRFQLDLLRHVPDPQPPGTSPPNPARRPAVHEHVPGIGRTQPQDDAQHGGLARAVRPDEPGELPRRDAEGDLVQDLPAAEAHTDRTQLQRRCGCRLRDRV
jgi:hypothetical protein